MLPPKECHCPTVRTAEPGSGEGRNGEAAEAVRILENATFAFALELTSTYVLNISTMKKSASQDNLGLNYMSEVAATMRLNLRRVLKKTPHAQVYSVLKSTN